MRVMPWSCAWIACLWSSACRSSPPCPEVPVLERFDIRYSGRMDGTAFQTEPAASTPVRPEGERVVVHTRVLSLPLHVASRLLPDAPASGGGSRFGFGVDCARVPAEHLRRALDGLIAARVASEVGTPRVPCVLGSTAHVAQLAQCSYISAFEVKALPQAMVGDPVVATALEGYDLRLRPERDEDRVSLDVSLRATGLLRPMATAASPLTYGTLPVQIQVPVFFHQELGTRPSLRPGEAVCVMCPQPPDREEVVLLVFECEHQREELPALARR
jgi:hypothetical protein